MEIDGARWSRGSRRTFHTINYVANQEACSLQSSNESGRYLGHIPRKPSDCLEKEVIRRQCSRFTWQIKDSLERPHHVVIRSGLTTRAVNRRIH